MSSRGGNGGWQRIRQKVDQRKLQSEETGGEDGGDEGGRRSSRRGLRRKEEEESTSSQERKTMQKMERKKKVEAEEDSSNEDTSSREKGRRQKREWKEKEVAQLKLQREETGGEDEGGRRSSRRGLGRKEEEESTSSQEREKRRKMERKKKVEAEEDSSNEDTSSREMCRRQGQEDYSNDSSVSSESEEDDDSDTSFRQNESGKEDSQVEGDDNDDEDDEMDGSVEDYSDGDGSSDDEAEYIEEDFVKKCVSMRYAPGTRTGFDQRYRKMKKWLHQNAKQWLPLKVPFHNSLCILWVNHQMTRRKNGALLGAGNLNAHIQMLKFKGFTSNHEVVPHDLEQFFKNAHQAHKRRVMTLVDNCQQELPDSHAQNASWAAVEYLAEKLHDWKPGRGHDVRSNMFLTGAIQTISRGERVGKVPMTSFRMGNTGDHICAGKGLSSKTDPTGLRSYDKRFWANYTNEKMCFVTALGRHLLSLPKHQQSKFLFMSRTEAKTYARKLKASRKTKNHKPSNIGPHLKFDRLIAKVFKKLPSHKRVAMGISKTKNFVGHCKRKSAFARAVDGDGPDANMIGNRADHRTTNHHTYSARPIFGVEGSGGPPARHDITMSKLLAGLTQYTPEFNTSPPHWDSYAIEQIPWKEIMPCYEELPEGMQALVPFAVAQVVYHYHGSNCGMSSSHDLFKSPLWTTHQGLRTQMHKALRGADTGQDSVLSQIYCDKKTDVYLWTKGTNETITEMQKDIKEMKKLQKEQMQVNREILRKLNANERPNLADVQHQDSNGDGPGMEELRCDSHSEQASDSPKTHHQQRQSDNLVLPAPPDVFEIEHGLNVESAWHGWHGSYHNDSPGGAPSYPWKKINPDSLCLSKEPAKRRATLQLLSKIKCLVAFLQGGAADAEVEKDVSHAWDVCKQSAMENLKAEGITEWPLFGSIRTAYLRLKQLQKTIIEKLAKRDVDTTQKKTVQRQASITSYFNQSGMLLDMSDAVEVSEEQGDDAAFDHASATSSEGNAFDLFSASSSRPAEDCMICPLCPDSGANGRDLVVYRNSKALWQHWDAHHAGDPKPWLWQIHRVQGTKLLQARSSPWTRVEHALSFHAPDYKLKKMREEILAGSRRLENGTFVELQPDSQGRATCIRWFAVIRDGRVQGGQITVEYCADNCQTVADGQMQKVWVECILRVGSGPQKPFDDVPVSYPSVRASKTAATIASCTPRKKTQPSLTTPSPHKSPQSSPSYSSGSQKQTDQNHPNASSVQPAKKVASASSAKINLHHEPGSIHDKETDTIVARIAHKTKNDANALKQFHDASKLLEDAGWSRCRTTEQEFSYANIMNPSYSVKQIPRDGKCMYHCLLEILKAERVMGAPKNEKDLRMALANFVETQVPPEGYDEGKYGGIYTTEGVYLHLEESLLDSYGGEATLAVFVQLYGITLHCNAPESNGSVVTHRGDGKDANQYHMLHTLSWETWTEVQTFDEKEQVTTTSYERSYLGDHWQLLQPASEVQPRGKGNAASASSAAATAPKHQRQMIARVAPQQLDFCESEQSAAPKRTSTEFQGPLSVQFMLRQVSSSKLFLRGASVQLQTKLHNMLRVFTLNNLNFLEDDFGEDFCRVYARNVQELLYALPDLNVPHRSFFIALGMGADVDPYTLQYMFQSHAMQVSKLRLPPGVLLSGVKTLKEPGAPVHFKILQWCWPAGFDAFRIFVLQSDCNKMSIFQTKSRSKKVDIILRCERNHYTLLHAIEGATANDLMKTVMCENEHILHETHLELRCPDVSTFDSFCNETSYLSAALQGSEPGKDDLDLMWNEATSAAGLEYDTGLQKWIRFPDGVKNTQLASNTDGSLQVTSWKDLQQRLLAALEGDRENGQQHQRRHSTKSPPHAEAADDVCIAGVTFMDAGSESGKGMYRMMSDKRITHVAGVELQKPWFDASCKIMAHLRQSFAKRNYRMPAVTILHSCMLDVQNKFPELTFLYSSAGLLWMCNYAFDNPRAPYCATKASNTKKPMPLVPGCNDLSTNAARKFSHDFTGVTWLAVHNPEGFWSSSHYTPFKPIKVNVTWSSKLCDVTILRHVQHIEITEDSQQKKGGRVHTKRLNLPSPTQHDLKLWDDYMMQFSNLVPRLYKVISGERFLQECRREEESRVGAQVTPKRGKSKIHSDDKKNAIIINSDDEAPGQWSRSNAIASSGATRMINAMRSAGKVPGNHLVMLRDSFWITTEVICGYQDLLTTTFPNMRFQFLFETCTIPKKCPKIIVGFCNLQNVHWIAIKLDMIQNYVAIADSLHNTFQHMHNDVFRMVETYARRLGHRGELTHYTVDVPDQCNCNDCGVFACLFQLYMAQTVSA